MAMADSIQVVDDDYMRRIHSNRGSGRLHKGTNVYYTEKINFKTHQNFNNS